jgi:hypothetical protein
MDGREMVIEAMRHLSFVIRHAQRPFVTRSGHLSLAICHSSFVIYNRCHSSGGGDA